MRHEKTVILLFTTIFEILNILMNQHLFISVETRVVTILFVKKSKQKINNIIKCEMIFCFNTAVPDELFLGCRNVLFIPWCQRATGEPTSTVSRPDFCIKIF